MHFLFIALFLFLTQGLSAATYTARIHDIDRGTQINDEVLIFLSNGQVAKLSTPDAEQLDELDRAFIRKSWLEFVVNKHRTIVSYKELSSFPNQREIHFAEKGTTDYRPTILSSLADAKTIFKDARHNKKESQCYNRAHVWAYEWRVKHKIYSSKAWLFFTRKYIRKFNFQWWFHVSPYFHVVENGKVKEKIADVKYGRTLMTFKQWTDIFLRNNAECPLVDDYSEHANYPESGWCFLMKSSMYYYQPIDLEMLEKDSIVRSTWSENEVKASYLEAFDIDLNQI